LEQTVVTLGLTFSATLISLMGIPSIWAARERVAAIIRLILDFMQTMPAFVHLIPPPCSSVFGRAGIIATQDFRHAPPAVRLTNLGIRQVIAEIIEAGQLRCTPTSATV
jgi:glycine betaine/proline transport system permease protein